MANIACITLDVADPTAAQRFYAEAFGLDSPIRTRVSQDPTTGFRGYMLALTVSQPATVDNLIAGALAAGATTLKPATKSLWGYAGVVQAPDGEIWKIATSAKKNTGPATRQIDDIVLLVGVADVVASKRFYVGRGLTVAKSFGRTYAEFDAGSGCVTFALYRRRALAKEVGVAPEGSGSHGFVIGGGSEPFTDPDGFEWQTAASLPLTSSS